MDSMSSMMRSSTMPLQEYLLQGSILENHRDVLLHRLNGLCDMVDTGPEKFFDHEMVYTLRKEVGSPNDKIWFLEIINRFVYTDWWFDIDV